MLEAIGNFIIHLISQLGYFGIILTMAIESALIPLPSEVIMPFSGYLAATGHFNIHLVAFAGAIGNVLGSLVAYAFGYWGNERIVRRFIRKYGKWILVTEEELDSTEKMLHKYKDLVIIGSRILPGIRTVISLPAGIAKLPLMRFIVLTFMGSLVWSYLLAYVGYVLGANWHSLGPIFHKLDAVIIIGIVGLIAAYIYYKLRKTAHSN